jgi:hypothetical protein
MDVPYIEELVDVEDDCPLLRVLLRIGMSVSSSTFSQDECLVISRDGACVEGWEYVCENACIVGGKDDCAFCMICWVNGCEND